MMKLHLTLAGLVIIAAVSNAFAIDEAAEPQTNVRGVWTCPPPDELASCSTRNCFECNSGDRAQSEKACITESLSKDRCNGQFRCVHSATDPALPGCREAVGGTGPRPRCKPEVRAGFELGPEPCAKEGENMYCYSYICQAAQVFCTLDFTPQ